MLDRLRHVFRSSLHAHSNNRLNPKRPDGPPPLHRLPAELVCMIARELPEYSRGFLALSSKRLYWMLSMTLGDLRLAAETPSNFQEENASHPLGYQVDRWIFLCVLEREMWDRWALCSCCLKFHPKGQFPEAELRLPPEKRACRSRPPLTAENGWGNWGWPMGIVNLCPCLKLTPGTRQRLRAYVRGAGGLTANAALAPPWWHQCRKVYGDVEIQVALNPFVCQDGALGVVTRYHYSFSPRSATLSPRLCCPHRNLDTWVNDVLTCQATHPGRASCPTCKVLTRCRYCGTSMGGLTKRGASTDSRISCTFWTERMLDDDIWYAQIVFPFYKISGDSCSGPLRSPWISLYRFRKEVGVWRP